VPKPLKKLLPPLFLLVLICLFGASFGQRFSSNRVILPPPTNYPLPTPNIYFKEEINGEVKTIAPWDHALDVISPEPVFPTIDQLDRIYLLLRGAVVRRDKKALVNYLSQERLWYFENPRKLGEETSQGQKVFLRDQSLSQDERIPELLYMTPEVDQTKPIAIIKKSNDPGLLTPESFLFVDEATGVSQVILDLPWRYVVEVEYETKVGSKKPAGGKAIFVYDKTSWKYQGETWNFLSQETVTFGKEFKEGVVVHEIRLVDNRLSPKELKIKKGDSVVWKNITGVIYSYGLLSDNWNSPFLMNDNFVWSFDKEGSYSYRIAGVLSSEGIIDVE